MVSDPVELVNWQTYSTGIGLGQKVEHLHVQAEVNG